MLLGLKTDSPIAELYLYASDGTCIGAHTWEAGRQLAQGLLAVLEAQLSSAGASRRELTGIIVFQGPGSFTGLRIGIAVANALSYALGIPIIGASGEKWQEVGLKRLVVGENDKVVLPHYGAEARITLPKK